MKRLLIWIFVLIALTSFGYADQTCYVNEVCTFETPVTNGSAYYNGSVTNSLFKEDITYYLDEPMTQIVRDGSRITYVYNYTFNFSGEYTRESIVNVTNFIPVTELITVKDLDETSLAGLIMSNWTMIVIIILILAIVGIFALINKNNS